MAFLAANHPPTGINPVVAYAVWDVLYSMTEPEPQPVALTLKRRRFQYSLRTLLLLVYVGGPCLGWIGIAAKEYLRPRTLAEQALQWLKEHPEPRWPNKYIRRARTGGLASRAPATCFAGGLPFLQATGKSVARPPLSDERKPAEKKPWVTETRGRKP